MRLHVLDATYELFRAFFGGGPPRQAPDGRDVKGVVGIIESTLSLLRQPDVTHLAAATDKVIRSFRNDLYDGYKTEEGMDPDILAQFPLAERALEALGVVVWKMEEFEADEGFKNPLILLKPCEKKYPCLFRVPYFINLILY